MQSSDSEFYKSTFNSQYQLYMSSIGASSNLYNGSEYVGSYPGVHGFPYFEATDYYPGKISYDHVIYMDIPMKYDLVQNELVIRGYQEIGIKLASEKVDSFYLMNHFFIHIFSDSINGKILPSDFYERLYNGNLKILVKRKKIVEHSFHPENPEFFKESSNYFIISGDHYYKIEDKQSLMNVFRDKKEELRIYWRQKKFNYKKDPETAIIQMTIYYDQLKK
jgi:hypothetical protein